MATQAGDLRRKALSERMGSFISSAVFEAFHVAGQDASMSSPLFIVVTGVCILQFLALPLRLLMSTEPAGEVIGTVLQALAMLRVDELYGSDGLLVTILVFFAANTVGWMIIAYAATLFYLKRPAPAAVVLGMRSIASVGMPLLSFPFLNVAMRGAACTEGQSVFGTQCYTGSHLAIALCCIALWVSTLPLYMMSAAVFIDRNPLSGSLAARTHGRLDVTLLISKGVLSVMFNAFSLEGTNWFTIIALSAVVAAWIMGYLRLAPMIHPAVNDVMVAAGFGMAWAMLGVALERLASDQQLTSMILIGVPLSFVFAIYVARYRRVSICRQSLQDLDSLYDVDLWARSRLQLHQQLTEDASDTASMGQHWNAGGGQRSKSALASTRGLASNVARSIGVSGATGTRGAAVHLASQVIIRLGSSYAEDERMTTVLAAEVELAYQTMMDKFPSSSLAHLLAATYFRLAHPSRYMELHALNLARKSNAPLDVSFFIYQRTRDLIDMDTSYLPSGELRSGVAGTKAITPVDRTAYEGRLLGAFNAQTACYRALLRVWDALQEPVPDLAELQRMGELLWSNLDDAERHFKVLLTMNPEGVSVLRAYAAFQRTLMHNATTAYELEGRADALADAAARTAESLVSRFTLMGPAPDLGFMEEGVAMITISTEVSRVGEILSVNSAACRLLLRNRSDLVGSNISVIMPKPISTVHDQFLLRYTRTGSAKLVGSTHQVLVQQSNGYIQPCRMHMQEAAPTMSDTSPRLAAVLQPMRVAENVILFGSEDEEFQIFSADAASHELMGTDPELLEDMGASVITYFPAVHPGYVNLDELDFDEAQGSGRSLGSGPGGAEGAAGNSNHSLLHASTFVKTPVRVDDAVGGLDMFDDVGGQPEAGLSGFDDEDGSIKHVMGYVQTLHMPIFGGNVHVLQWRRTEEDLRAEAATAAAEAQALMEREAPPVHKTVGPPPVTLELVPEGERTAAAPADQDTVHDAAQSQAESGSVGSTVESKGGPGHVLSPATNPGGDGKASRGSPPLTSTGIVRPHPIDVPPAKLVAKATAVATTLPASASAAASSAASRLAAHSMLTRKVIEAQRLMTDSSILTMRRILYALFVIVGLLAIILLAVLPTTRTEISLHTSSLYSGGRRAILSRLALEHVRGMEAAAGADGSRAFGAGNASFSLHRSLLGDVADELDAVKEALNADIQSLDGSQLNFETDRTISRTSAGGAVTLMNPSEATEDLLSSLHVLRFMDAAELVTGTGLSPYAVEVKENSRELSGAFSQSASLKLRDLNEFVADVGRLELIAMAAIFVVVFLAIAIAFSVLVRRLATKRSSALSVFLHVPPAAVKHMRDETAARLASHNRRVALETAGDAEAGSNDGEDDDDVAPAGRLGSEPGVKSGLASGSRARRVSSAHQPIAAQDGHATEAAEEQWDSYFTAKARSKAAKRLGLSDGAGASSAPSSRSNRSVQSHSFSELRRGTDSANWMQWSVAKVQAPVASLVLWLGLVYAMDFLAHGVVRQEVQRLFLAQRFSETFPDMLHLSVDLVANSSTSYRPAAVSQLVLMESDTLRRMQAVLSGTEYVAVSQLSSSPTLQPLEDTRTEFSALLLQGCAGLANAASCSQFSAGVIDAGLMTGTHSFLATVRRVIGAVDVTNSSQTVSELEPLVGDEVRRVAVFEREFFRTAFDSLAASFRDASLEAQRQFSNAELALTLSFLVIFLLFIGPAYLQLVTSLGRTVKASRILLTAFPEPLMFRMPMVQAEVQGIAHQFTSSHFMTAAAGSGMDSALATVLGKGSGMGGRQG